MKLAILVPTTPNREPLLKRMLQSLAAERFPEVEVLIESDNFEKSIGEKRNLLLRRATAEYVAFIDSDDTVSTNYLPSILQAIRIYPHAIGLNCLLHRNGEERAFVHSSKYTTWSKFGDVETKPLVHLNPILREIALKVPYQHKNWQEDTQYAKDLMKSGLVKSEILIPETLYHYHYSSETSDAKAHRFDF